MFLVTLLAIFLALALLRHAAIRRMSKAVANLPGPYNFPLFGGIHFYSRLNPKDFLQFARKAHIKYGNFAKLWVFHRLVVISADVELNEQILTSQQCLVKQRNYRMLRQWLGEGLLLSDGKKWYARRKIITPAFHFKILEQFVEVFDQQSNELLQRLAQPADGVKAFDVYPFVCLAALDIIAETAMGTKIHAQTDTHTEYADAVNKVTSLLIWRFMKPHLNSELVFSILYPHLKWRQTQLIKLMHNFTNKVIAERRQTLEASRAAHVQDSSATEECDIGSKRRMALLDILLQSTIDGQPLSNADICEEVDTFMFEGHDTTTSAISFTLHLISRHAPVQAKLLAEVQQVLGTDATQPIKLSSLNELKYLECVIKEAMRLYPPVPIIARELEQDFKYTHSEFGDGFLPAGTEFMIAIHAMMLNEHSFKNSHAFIPERHEHGTSPTAFTMIPFSAGPRNCIGQKFAMLEMKTVIGKIVREYELLPFGEAVVPEANIVLRSSTKFQLGMRKRL